MKGEKVKHLKIFYLEPPQDEHKLRNSKMKNKEVKT